MKGSWRIARLAGVDIDVHWSFSFIILWVIIQGVSKDRDLQNTILVLIGVLLVFGCIILHELGHAFMALSLKVKVKNITLLPFGGLAQIQVVPDKPLYELLIAIAGPLVNLAIGVGLFAVLVIYADSNLLSDLASSPITVIDSLILSFFQHNTWLGLVMLLLVTNTVLFAFNLIPAFPMDGGRILRAALIPFFSYPRATRIAMGVGFALATLLIILAFQRRNIGLFFVAAFIFLAARPARVKSPQV